MELASVSKDDLVYDMGCGDGRILIMAAKKYGARGIGIDLDPARIAEMPRASLPKSHPRGTLEVSPTSDPDRHPQ